MINGEFAKYQGLGNDYLVVSPTLLGQEPRASIIQALCDRHRGPGSDGVLAGGPGAEGEFALRIFNPDGSEAEKSGNGLRIFVRHLRDLGLARMGEELRVRTKGGLTRAWILDPGASTIRVDMGEPSFEPGAVGLAPELAPGGQALIDRPWTFGGTSCRITCLSMGNPHCVVQGPPVTPETAKALGPLICASPLFRNQTNVQFLEVVSPTVLRIEIWERGAGYTLASGSSSCAAASAARRLGLVGEALRVAMPGGSLDLAFEGDHVLMTGPVEEVYRGRLSPDLLGRLESLGRATPS